VDHPVFDHDGPWTEAAYLDLEGNDGRVEVVDGTLLVGPAASEQRTVVVTRLGESMSAALPDGLSLVSSIPLRLGRDCVLIPDFVVTNSTVVPDPNSRHGGRPAVLDASDALMVIEIVGGDHGAADRTFKPQLYARSRIPYSLLIDHDAPFAVADMIISGRYHEYATAGEGDLLRLDEPFSMELDLSAVTARAARPETSAPAAS
jgi:Putative restriction endonuclease